MDKTLKYRKIILNLLEAWKSYKISNRPNVCIYIHIDKTENNFIVLNYGWDKDNYIYNILFHIELREDTTVWLHEDTTGVGIAKELAVAGIAATDLVVGFAEVSVADLVTAI